MPPAAISEGNQETVSQGPRPEEFVTFGSLGYTAGL